MTSADSDNVITPITSDRELNNKRQLKIFLKSRQEDPRQTGTQERHLQPYTSQLKPSQSSQQITAPMAQALAVNSSLLQKSSMNSSNHNIVAMLPNLTPSSPNHLSKPKGKFSWRDPSPMSVDMNPPKNRDATTTRQEKDTPQVNFKFDLKRRLKDTEDLNSRDKRLPTTREELDSNSPTAKQLTEEESTGIPINKKPEIKWVGESWPDIYQEIEFTKVIGQGSFAKVYSAIDLQSKQRVAVKVIDKRKVGEINCRKMVDKELEIVSALDHPNIVKFHRLIEDKKRVLSAHEDLLRHGDVRPLHAQPVLPH